LQQHTTMAINNPDNLQQHATTHSNDTNNKRDALKNVYNGRESAVNTALDDDTYPG